MFYFGTPFLSKAAAVDWDHSVRLLNGMLAAVAQQTDRRFHHIISCHDVPDIKEEYKPFVTFLPVHSPIPKEIMEMRRDKGLKKRTIAAHVREQGGGYLMFLDADDLIHHKLVEHAYHQNDPHGYIVKNGYMHYEGTKKVAPMNGTFNDQCGSCAIIKFAPDDLPKTVDDEENYFTTFKSHRTWEAHAESNGRPLQRIPFPAVIYLRTPNVSISGRFFPEIGLRGIKKKIKRLLNEKPLTEDIRRDFALR